MIKKLKDYIVNNKTQVIGILIFALVLIAIFLPKTRKQSVEDYVPELTLHLDGIPVSENEVVIEETTYEYDDGTKMLESNYVSNVIQCMLSYDRLLDEDSRKKYINYDLFNPTKDMSDKLSIICGNDLHIEGGNWVNHEVHIESAGVSYTICFDLDQDGKLTYLYCNDKISVYDMDSITDRVVNIAGDYYLDELSGIYYYNDASDKIYDLELVEIYESEEGYYHTDSSGEIILDLSLTEYLIRREETVEEVPVIIDEEVIEE